MSLTPYDVSDLEPYLADWRRLVATWVTAGRRGPDAARLVLSRVLDQGLEAVAGVPDPGEREVSAEQSLRCEVALLELSGVVDGPGYLQANPRLAQRGVDPVTHFCEAGWRSPLNPSLDFDVWWYQAQYLDPGDDRVNPLVHYVLVGRAAGHRPLPDRPERPAPTALSAERPGRQGVRRVCLFAGYDVDGIVDDYVVAYLRELSRHADVYYLADCVLEHGELDKLRDVTVAAWSIRHSTYDFGSYSRLARDLVGWDVIEQYDELLLANDSCYLLRPLDDVLTAMASRACDWWGLQMTSRHFQGVIDGAVGDPAAVRRPMPGDEVRAGMPRSVFSYDDFVHVGSYLVAFRQPVLRDPGFRKRIDRVSAQRTKLALIYRYETGTTQYLVGQGFAFSTYIDELYPYHPVYGPGAFELIERGFPLLKRQLLAENPYETPDLRDWRSRVLSLVPEAPVDVMERNLLRVAPDDALRRSFSIVTLPDGSVRRPMDLSGRQLRARDRRLPTYDHWWAFPVCAYDHTFASNERAVFEEVRDDPSIKKIVLTRSRPVHVDGENVVVVPLNSDEGRDYVFRSRHIFVKHGPTVNIPFRMAQEEHTFINLWHGIPLKRFGFASVENLADPELLAEVHRASRAVITSSRIDTLAMAAAFHPLSIQDMWPTGLPRNDFIVRDADRMPADLLAQEQRLLEEADGRRLVLFLPTFKSGQVDAYYRFTPDDLAWLAEWCERHHAVIGVREHMADKARTYSHMLAALDPINVSSRRYPDLEVLYRAADSLITDYSSCVVDFLLTGKPVISFAYDYERYATQERGLFYDLEQVLPGPVCRDFGQLSEALDDLFTPRTPSQVEEYDWKRRTFFDHLDDQSAWRVVQRVKALYVNGA